MDGSVCDGAPANCDAIAESHLRLRKSEEGHTTPRRVTCVGRIAFSRGGAKSGRENASALWAEAMGKAEKGWLCSPAELAVSGKPGGTPSRCYNIAFRFGAEQAAKLRACDDMKRIPENQA